MIDFRKENDYSRLSPEKLFLVWNSESGSKKAFLNLVLKMRGELGQLGVMTGLGDDAQTWSWLSGSLRNATSDDLLLTYYRYVPARYQYRYAVSPPSVR
jgi:hypothetical protein